ncbi:hypothetical protein BU26DRAFT_228177 [Trematosphaeria pertusa]|uniref:Uncharacterized protein n=1 Tax=Trematosphaeria pertusa TaxID=390896 RepID=A0A6A6IVN5_9PLEO|nr:uncharacterized protein BU26DRAFT_228177 [Trematosphaeria pertusa]KAF2253680.1 hypothetical protein BU26DRAFT_228177 [Trematosphaeria pertusa]
MRCTHLYARAEMQNWRNAANKLLYAILRSAEAELQQGSNLASSPACLRSGVAPILLFS